MGFISRLYKELKIQKNHNAINKWANELNREFSKDDKYMANKYIKKCSTSLAIKEMQCNLTFRFLLISVRMSIINNTNQSKCWQACGEKGTPMHSLWDCP
jgi:hypothetical protein